MNEQKKKDRKLMILSSSKRVWAPDLPDLWKGNETIFATLEIMGSINSLSHDKPLI